VVAGDGAVRGRRDLGWLGAGLGGAGLLVGLLASPSEAVQGDAQRLMYLHVPAAWTAYLAFAAVLVSSLGYLIWRDPRWDRAGRAAAEIGVGLTALAIAVGSVWGRAVWGVWWTWDPRLVTTVFLLLVYCGYLALRGTGPDRAAAFRAAVLGVVGFAMVPLVHLSVVWWRSLHQQATLLAPSARPPIDYRMATALLLCVGAFTATGGWLFLRRLARLEQQVGLTVDARSGFQRNNRPGDRTAARPGADQRTLTERAPR
jgi:heme exporter protein C